MSNKGIMLNDWVVMICLGFFWFFLGAILVSIFMPADVTLANIAEDLPGFAVLALILVGLFDLGLLFVIWGWGNRHRASTISLGADTVGRRSYTDINNPLGMNTDGGTSVSGQQQAAVNAVSRGLSGIFTIYLWAQRITAVIAVIIAALVAAFCWLSFALGWMSGNKSLNVGMFIILGLAIASYVIIGLFMLLRKITKTST